MPGGDARPADELQAGGLQGGGLQGGGLQGGGLQGELVLVGGQVAELVVDAPHGCGAWAVAVSAAWPAVSRGSRAWFRASAAHKPLAVRKAAAGEPASAWATHPPPTHCR
ncbi:hypothetical protein GCM10017687_54800 [Streptomyces echinatus]